MITVSPILISFLLISSSLWRVALDTVVPDMNIGSSSATGVRTRSFQLGVTAFNFVCPCSGLYLYAQALWESWCMSKNVVVLSFVNFNVAPSVAYGKVCLLWLSSRIDWIRLVSFLTTLCQLSRKFWIY